MHVWSALTLLAVWVGHEVSQDAGHLAAGALVSKAQHHQVLQDGLRAGKSNPTFKSPIPSSYRLSSINSAYVLALMSSVFSGRCLSSIGMP